MKPTGCESCGLAEGLAILEVKLLKFDVKMLKLVQFGVNLAVPHKRHRAEALQPDGFERNRELGVVF